MSQTIDIMFLESQMDALKAFADETLFDDCIVTLYSDGSTMVENASGTSFAFNNIRQMLTNLEKYRHD